MASLLWENLASVTKLLEFTLTGRVVTMSIISAAGIVFDSLVRTLQVSVGHKLVF